MCPSTLWKIQLVEESKRTNSSALHFRWLGPNPIRILFSDGNHLRSHLLQKVIENWASRLEYIRASRDGHLPFSTKIQISSSAVKVENVVYWAILMNFYGIPHTNCRAVEICDSSLTLAINQEVTTRSTAVSQPLYQFKPQLNVNDCKSNNNLELNGYIYKQTSTKHHQQYSQSENSFSIIFIKQIYHISFMNVDEI